MPRCAGLLLCRIVPMGGHAPQRAGMHRNDERLHPEFPGSRAARPTRVGMARRIIQSCNLFLSGRADSSGSGNPVTPCSG